MCIQTPSRNPVFNVSIFLDVAGAQTWGQGKRTSRTSDICISDIWKHHFERDFDIFGCTFHKCPTGGMIGVVNSSTAVEDLVAVGSSLVVINSERATFTC
jgi:hypothetical protein